MIGIGIAEITRRHRCMGLTPGRMAALNAETGPLW